MVNLNKFVKQDIFPSSVCRQVLFGGITIDVMAAGTWSVSIQGLEDIESC